ncbi:MgtC/SapB family protein [Clostridium sp. Ade.TY]|uniref:MgtC/SapB family protein n=1 Tax=Clostridium sp. Ade.TY TaxID=1391647 RepID=UPI00041118D8|nr:MgtC/SapB family protein [Clostridium sp. Ade.TY]
MTLTDFTIRILVAIVLGFVIGLERQYRQTLAGGIRTNVLVCVGACIFVMYSYIATGDNSPRIAGQVVTGVGFLGGGVILRDGFNVRGLNTAATLWCTAAVGILTSTGNLTYAIVAAIAIVLSNIILRPIAKKMYHVKNSNTDGEYLYGISIKCLESEEFNIRSLLMQMVGEEKILLKKLESTEIESESKVRVKAEIISIEKSDMIIERIIGVLSLEQGVISVGWNVLND